MWALKAEKPTFLFYFYLSRKKTYWGDRKSSIGAQSRLARQAPSPMERAWTTRAKTKGTFLRVVYIAPHLRRGRAGRTRRPTRSNHPSRVRKRPLARVYAARTAVLVATQTDAFGFQAVHRLAGLH